MVDPVRQALVLSMVVLAQPLVAQPRPSVPGECGFGTRIRILGPGMPNQGFIGGPEFQSLFEN
jgi:hypothetical protein